MKMNVFEKLFFSLVASIIINFILGCIFTWTLLDLLWTIGVAGFSGLSKDYVTRVIIEFFAFLVPWSIYNIYRYHLWKKFKKPTLIYICTWIIPSFFISFIIIILHIFDCIMYGSGRHSFI